MQNGVPINACCSRVGDTASVLLIYVYTVQGCVIMHHVLPIYL